MSTFLQLLRISSWLLPLQKGLAVLGLLICVSAAFAVPKMKLATIYFGLAFPVLVWLACSGVLLRVLSSRRQLRLLPWFRLKMLAASVVMPVVAALISAGACWLVAHSTVPAMHLAPAVFAVSVQTLLFAGEIVIGFFIASRAPIVALILILLLLSLSDIVALVSPQLAAWIDEPGGLGASILVAYPLIWMVFGIWYLLARTIGPAAFLLEPMSSEWISRSFISGLRADREQPLSRETAMERLLLGKTTGTLAATCFLMVIVLVGTQLITARHVVYGKRVAMLFCSLSLVIVAAGAVAYRIARRSRSLWLTGGRERRELHLWCERLVLRSGGVIVLPFLAAAVLLWMWLPVRPALPLPYILSAIVLPAAAAAWLALLQVKPDPWLQTIVCFAILACWMLGLVVPLFLESGAPRWGLIGFQVLLVIVLRQMAARRWGRADWPRRNVL